MKFRTTSSSPPHQVTKRVERLNELDYRLRALAVHTKTPYRRPQVSKTPTPIPAPAPTTASGTAAGPVDLSAARKKLTAAERP